MLKQTRADVALSTSRAASFLDARYDIIDSLGNLEEAVAKVHEQSAALNAEVSCLLLCCTSIH